MTDEDIPDASIADLFPPDKIAARFVVAMSMARNDIERALRDGIRAAEKEDQDFNYRVRLVTSHLIEALESLRIYTETASEVKELMSRVPTEYRKELTTARSTVQKVGADVLEQVRHNTFHVPSPDSAYTPTSDEQLQRVLEEVRDHRAVIHMDHRGEQPIFWLTFADDVALALALAKHSADEEVAKKQFEITSTGAVAFTKWVDALVMAYMKATGSWFGTPELYDPGHPGE